MGATGNGDKPWVVIVVAIIGAAGLIISAVIGRDKPTVAPPVTSTYSSVESSPIVVEKATLIPTIKPSNTPESESVLAPTQLPTATERKITATQSPTLAPITAANQAFISGNYEKGIELYTKAAVQNDADALCQLGYMYSQGLGVDQDRTIAEAYYSRAARLGSVQAERNWLAMVVVNPYSYNSIIAVLEYLDRNGSFEIKEAAYRIMAGGTAKAAQGASIYLGSFAQLSPEKKIKEIEARTEWRDAGYAYFSGGASGDEFNSYELVGFAWDDSLKEPYPRKNDKKFVHYRRQFIDTAGLIEKALVE